MAEIHITRLEVEDILGHPVETEAVDFAEVQRAMCLPWPVTAVKSEGVGDLCLEVKAPPYGERQHIMPQYSRTDEGLRRRRIIAY